MLNFFKRSPRVGDGKDPTMSHPTESPGATVPVSAAPALPDVSQQIAALTDAVNRLVQSGHATRDVQPSGAALVNVGGHIPGGAALAPAVDVARLSPLQQITLGLRDAKPVGPATIAPNDAEAGARRDDKGAAPAGAD